MKIRRAKLLVIASIISLLTIFAYTVSSRNTNADAPDIIVNELMYNPASNVDNDEFIELYNTTSSTIDLSNWCFTRGITLCFSSGTSLAANSYGIISPNAPQTLSTYGKATIGTYTGKLDNGGERITLVNSSSQVISDFTYDDTAPWPTSPDGSGPSLELKDPTYNYTQASSWGASIGGATPGAINSLANLDPPVISNVSHPSHIQPSNTVTITAHVENAGIINLKYKVMFNTEQTVAMNDSGSSGDATSGDGIYSAQIPIQATGSLVRFKIEATNLDGTASAPGSDESINYLTYIVDDAQTSDLPIIRWYIDPAVYDDLITNHTQDDFYVPTVVAVGDQIFDNTRVKVKGQSSASYPKKKFTFDLPSGYLLGSPYFEHPVDEFSINAYFLNITDMQERLTWKVFSNFGFDDLQGQYARVQKNTNSSTSEFFGHYLMIEGYDKNWRERTGHEDGALYKQFDDKKTRKDEDNSDIEALRTNIQTLTGDNLKNYILDNLDVPAIVNYDAISTVAMGQDWGFYKNLYQYRDTEGTQRWSLLPWDLDNALAMPLFKEESTPMYFNLDPLHANNQPSYMAQRIIENAMYQFPEFREMYYRRAATLYDQIYKSGALLGWYDELYRKSRDTINEDLAKWQPDKAALLAMAFPGGIPWEFPDDFPLQVTPDQAMSGESTAEAQNQMYLYGYSRAVNRFEQERSQGNLPQSQKDDLEVIFSEINYSPGTGEDGQFLELYNPNDQAVDLSGWQISGAVSLEFPQGSVIPAKSYGVVVKNDVQFRQTYSGSQLVLAEYQGSLTSESSNQLTLSNGEKKASSLVYGTDNPWPNIGSTDGFTLTLIRLDGDYTSPYCWAPSSSIGGTPGGINSPNSYWVNQNIDKCKDRHKIQSTSLAKTGDYIPSSALLGLVLIFGSATLLIARFEKP